MLPLFQLDTGMYAYPQALLVHPDGGVLVLAEERDAFHRGLPDVLARIRARARHRHVLRAYQHIDRVARPDLAVEIIPVNLKKAWGGDQDQDVLLRPLDEVAVRTELKAAPATT